MTVCAAHSMREAEYTHHTTSWIAPKISADGIFKCITAHYHKISSRNIFRGFKEQAFIVIEDEND